jgi:hypothetical protein
MAHEDKLNTQVALEHDQAQLANEEALRKRRIVTRRAQRAKKELAKRAAKRRRMFKVVAAWISAIFVIFLAAAWFLPGVVAWLRGVLFP